MKPALPLDTHAHVDPTIGVPELSKLGAFVFAMTRSVPEFETTIYRRDARTIWGVGLHPGLVAVQRAFDSDAFARMLKLTPIVGEVGLDATSRVPMATQVENFRAILHALQDSPRIVSVHSSGAHAQVLRELSRIPTSGVILHWWTGTEGFTEEAVRLGCYFSFPPGATGTLDLIRQIPSSRVLPETDHPSGDRRGPSPRKPGNVREVEMKLGALWGLSAPETRQRFWLNLAALVAETGTLDLFGKEWQSALGPDRSLLAPKEGKLSPEPPARRSWT